IALETTTDEAWARDCGVVLAAAGVPARIERSSGGWAVLVADVDLGRARAALAAYVDDAVASPVGGFEYGPTWAGLVVAAILIAVVPLTGFRAGARPAFLAGEGTAAFIVAGQPWRAVTSLVLHADAAHLFGNVVATAVLATALCRLLGPGLG